MSEVMSNWGSILSVLGMVGGGLVDAQQGSHVASTAVAGDDSSGGGDLERLQTLVRIPVDVPRNAVDGLREELEATNLSRNPDSTADGA